MKKGYLYTIIVVLVLIIVGESIYIVTSKNTDTKDKYDRQPNYVADSIKYEDIKEEENKIIESYTLTMNGKTIPLEVEFSIWTDGDHSRWINGLINNNTVFSIEDSDIYSYTEEYEFKKNFTISNIKENFNESNFRFIKGTDGKTYLTVVDKEINPADISYFLVILNDNLKEIKSDDLAFAGTMPKNFTIITTATGFGTLDGTNPWFKDEFKVCEDSAFSLICNINVQLSDDKIEYLQVTENKSDYYILEKRTYTINNDKLSYKVDSQYKVEGIAGQAP